jgi:hypothetical protein
VAAVRAQLAECVRLAAEARQAAQVAVQEYSAEVTIY